MILLKYTLLYLSALIVGISVLVAFVHLLKTDSIYVKLITLEVIANLFLSGICIYAVIRHQYVYLDICLALALIMFASTVAYCQYLNTQQKLKC